MYRVPMEQTDPKTGVNYQQATSSPNWTINVSDIRTVKVSNISLTASERDVMEFLSFSGDIHFVEMQRETGMSQLAYVTFKDSRGADTAILLSGSTIGDHSVSITPVENYQLPPHAPPLILDTKLMASGSAVKKAEDVVSTMLAKGFVLGKDAFNKAKSFDERLHLTSNASATVASIDRKIGLSEKLSAATAAVNVKVREMNEQYQVSEKTKSALAAAELTASNAGSAIMSNRYVSTGASWVSGAFTAVAKAAEDVSTMTKEKVGKAEEEKQETLYKERAAIVSDFAHLHLDDSSAGELPVVPVSSDDERKLGII
ncbi:hypothetical protein RJ640_012461 [Escallonia rubra]|uniref:RRM domain-containing protein n=1 Tax=Escallonia rubra TaxID=112253 RepID=A0AA88R6D9_9ASTE|nr:hypothetical protein RJ640_012461 [Escallonia rubra]